ncbi:hypothetical protein phiAS5_ORF0003 [Aeromonas phage phiAS5]|uniref:Uncharacterized protein n=1 Tax=Aeromonas phage phiAS5 TaxID=879630 RepID=E1A2A0_9CAUD|nr:hypothetical protein phiAS5_ORF0003 [Aeromonas phage phiAS5]ADM79846.1 hypothetical protein phiAS5_ORF0003 [Aeromonas phage phiAS5]BES53048.1 hypothetical protein [Aeromonas phage phiWae14]
MPTVKISDLPRADGFVGNEFGQVIQNGANKRAVILFADSNNKFVIPQGFTVSAETSDDIENVIEIAPDGKSFYLGPKSDKPVISADVSGMVVKNITVPNNVAYYGMTTEGERKELIKLGSDNNVTIGDGKSSLTLVQGSNHEISVRRESLPGKADWSDYRLIDTGIFKDYFVLQMNSIYTHGTDEPNDNDGYPDGHLYIKY